MSIDWVETTFEHVIEFFDQKRVPLSSKERSQRQGQYPYYGASGIIDYIDDYLFDGKYLLISEDGENLNSRQTPIAFFAQGKFWINNHAHIVRGIPNVADDYFLLSFIASSDLSGYITGTAQPKLSQANLKAIKIQLPPLSTQRAIASILSAYDNLIENNTRRIKILEQMAQAIYREWFVEFRAPGVKLRRAKIDEKKVTGKDQFPAGWELKQLGDIAQEVRRGVQPDQIDPDTPYFGLEHLPRKSIALSEWATANEVQSTKLQFKKGEILFGKIRPYFHKVGVAPLDGVCSTDAIVIVPKAPEYFALTLSCVSSEDFVNHSTQTSQGTKMPRANWDVLIKYPVLIPPEPLLAQFNALVQDAVDSIINMIFRNRNLRRTRDLLLPRLISGEVDVEKMTVSG